MPFAISFSLSHRPSPSSLSLHVLSHSRKLLPLTTHLVSSHLSLPLPLPSRLPLLTLPSDLLSHLILLAIDNSITYIGITSGHRFAPICTPLCPKIAMAAVRAWVKEGISRRAQDARSTSTSTRDVEKERERDGGRDRRCFHLMMGKRASAGARAVDALTAHVCSLGQIISSTNSLLHLFSLSMLPLVIDPITQLESEESEKRERERKREIDECSLITRPRRR